MKTFRLFAVCLLCLGLATSVQADPNDQADDNGLAGTVVDNGLVGTVVDNGAVDTVVDNGAVDTIVTEQNAVPEPAMGVLGLFAIAGLLATRRR